MDFGKIDNINNISSINIAEFNSDQLDKLIFNYPINNYIEVCTPLLYPNNDCISVYVYKSEEGNIFIINEDCESEIILRGLHFLTQFKKHQESFRCNGYKYSEGILYKLIKSKNKSNLYNDIFRMAQFIGQLFY